MSGLLQRFAASLSRLLAVAQKELWHLRRDRMSLGLIIGIPVIQFLLFGYAINTDARHLPLAVLDHDHGTLGRDLVQRLTATTYFDPVGEVRTQAEADEALRSGRVNAVLVLPVDWTAKRTFGNAVQAQLLVDGSDPLTVSSDVAAVNGLIDQLAVIDLAARAKHDSPVGLALDLRYNPEQRTAVYIVPGLIGVLLTMTLVMLTSLAIARERERGTIEALMASPVGRGELIIGKLLPFVAIGYLQMSIILGLGWALFGIAPGPQVGWLYLIAALFISANLAVGLVFSTLVATQGQAMQMSFLFLLPNILLSGYMFPLAAMPRFAISIAECLPLTHFLRVVRGITLKGAGPGDLVSDVVVLAVMVVVLLSFAIWRFQKRLV